VYYNTALYNYKSHPKLKDQHLKLKKNNNLLIPNKNDSINMKSKSAELALIYYSIHEQPTNDSYYRRNFKDM